uniref:uncharacterized protein LOC120333105 n=1 Tax=Styela clava TaxID=7725 RepID=UPI00193A846A|nr:uncharacterized protein LOC120333105 [Styela clava]
MDSRGFAGRENEPELQKMAAFLKERCDRGKYGLRYYENDKNMICIPWPTVPRQSEDIPDSFHMFTEWAYLSFRKRGGRGEQLETEALSAQKHRFRNALARADGLKCNKQLSTDTLRVYEFADTKKEKEQTENGNFRSGRGGNSPHSYYEQQAAPERNDYAYNVQMHHQGGIPDQREWENYGSSPMTVTSSPNHIACFQPQTNFQIPQTTEMQDDREPSIGTLIEEMINTPEPTLPDAPVTIDYQQPNGAYSTYAVPQPVRNVTTASHVPQQDYQMVQAPQLQVPNRYVTATAGPHMNGHSAVSPPQNLNESLLIKVYFRGNEVMKKSVTNSSGFRLYSGNNIPDMSRLLDTAQRDQLQRLTRFNSEYLFGPDSVEQVEMPSIKQITDKQALQTNEILSNMDRGLIFYIENANNDVTPYDQAIIPNVYCIRLCQTRVFPYGTNVQESDALECDGLARMKWAKIFDSNEFLRQMSRTGTTPSSTIKLSVGQKPKKQEGLHCLVSITVSVTQAKILADRQVEDQLDEIFISDKNSMDVAAQLIQNQIRQKIQLDDNAVVMRS